MANKSTLGKINRVYFLTLCLCLMYYSFKKIYFYANYWLFNAWVVFGQGALIVKKAIFFCG